MNQIILITDGCSNVGISPVAAAAKAYSEGIIVHVIGITDREGESGSGWQEVNEIAKAGGGMSRIVVPQEIAGTMQMMTRKTAVHTIRDIVNRELQQIVGPEAAVERLHPDKRGEVVQVIDRLSETVDLKVALLVDSSSSMVSKLIAVKQAARDLMLSLQARKGRSELAVFRFPDPDGSREVSLEVPWTERLANMRDLFYNLNMKGTTPTGPAILRVIDNIKGHNDNRRLEEPGWEQAGQVAASLPGKGGMLSDYVV